MHLIGMLSKVSWKVNVLNVGLLTLKLESAFPKC